MRKLREQRLVGVTVACGAVLALAVACSSDDTGGTGGSSGAGGSGNASGSSSGGKGGAVGTSGSANGGMSTGGTAHGGGGAANGGGGAANGGTAGTTSGGTGGAAGAGEAGDTGAAGAGGEAPFSPVEIPLLNSGFEDGYNNDPPPSWTRTGDVAGSYIGWTDAGSAHSGHSRLALYAGADYKVRTSQVVASAANGTYVLEGYAEGATTGINSLYLFATGYNSASPTDQVKTDMVVNGSYAKFTLSGIHVTSGTLTVGVYIDGLANAWTNFDDITLTRVE